MVPRWKQQLGGLLITLLGAGFTVWGWYTAIFERAFHRRASMIFPAFFVLGLGLMIFPGYKEERIARGEDISRLHGWRLITPRWWAIIALAFAAAGSNYFFLSSLTRMREVSF